MAADPLLPFLQQDGVLLLDGGLATEMEARGRILGDDLWSAGALIDDADLIRAVHLDYLRAGSDCITGASYQATIPGLMRRGLDEEGAIACLRLSVDLARQARDAFWSDGEARRGRRRPLVAASVGPYGAYLADGSEYRGDYDLDASGLAAFHERRFEVLCDSGPDLLACESIPSRDETRALLDLLRAGGTMRAWFAFTCRDAVHVSDGTPIAELAALLDGEELVAAVGVNCTPPRLIAPLLDELRHATSKPLVVYPNSGETYDAASRSWRGTRPAVDFAAAARDWVASGARLVGGCCRTGPDQIRRMKSALSAGA